MLLLLNYYNLLHSHEVRPRRRGQGQHPCMARVLVEGFQHLAVGVVSRGLVCLVHHHTSRNEKKYPKDKIKRLKVKKKTYLRRKKKNLEKKKPPKDKIKRLKVKKKTSERERLPGPGSRRGLPWPCVPRPPLRICRVQSDFLKWNSMIFNDFPCFKFHKIQVIFCYFFCFRF